MPEKAHPVEKTAGSGGYRFNKHSELAGVPSRSYLRAQDSMQDPIRSTAMSATSHPRREQKSPDTAEAQRLAEARQGVPWRRWGPYLSERQWGTVREDY